MATEENHPSLYSALYDAITDRRLIGDLLQHPDFRRRAGQICREVAGPPGGEELLREVCLRVLECADDLDPESIRGEGEFFVWFSRLARHIHHSNVLSAAAVNACTESPQRWPDSTADVPADDIGRFLTHADACPYHARILRVEDEELRAAFNRARGLDSRGRILLGEELQESITEHDRRLQNWREAASGKGASYGHVALFNGGVQVASCNKFYDFSLIHKSRNELDPFTGLQIYGVNSDDPSETVLLGFYALAGVRHGGKEKVLNLDNGYTVCLKVEELGGNNYEIHFRCVKTETLEEPDEAEGADSLLNEPPDEESREVSPFITVPPVAPRPGPPVMPGLGGWRLPRSLQAAGLLTILLIVALPSLLAGKMWGRMEVFEASFAEALRGHVNPAEAHVLAPVLAPVAEQVAPAQVKAAQPKPLSQVQTSEMPNADPRARVADGLRLKGAARRASEAGATREPVRGATTQPRAPAVGLGERVMLDDKENNGGSAMAMLLGPGRALPDTLSLNRVVDRRATTRLLSYDGRRDSSSGSVLHVTKNTRLGVILGGALQEQSLRVVRVTEQRPAMALLKVKWDVNVDSPSDTEPFVVTVYGYIFGGSEKIFGHRLSYKGVGSNLEDAYGDAVRQAVEQVVRWIRPDDDGALRASVSEAGGAAGQPRPRQRKEISAGENGEF